ncbi:unnamed protein product, partial [marine sediment metagenome]
EGKEVDVRVIAATNKDLSKEVSRNRFRLDLLGRLDILSVYLPHLSERSDDVPLLVERFALECDPCAQPRSDWTEELKKRPLAGNVRELFNLVRRALAEKDESAFDWSEDREETMCRSIQQALGRTGGNVSETARLLNMPRTTLIERMKKLDIKP